MASKYADFSIITSDNPNFEPPQNIMDEIAIVYENKESYILIADRKEAIEYAFNNAQKGDIILLAGKGHEKHQLIEGKKEFFSERKILEDLIESSNKVVCE